ncbi:hypothetical protein O988_01857 [Pseudogymnoascus sp. VKM F-3808]|nr:hypothetical protein O988_01857 [Pseudogymnoascus sp. VKM F-3808]
MSRSRENETLVLSSGNTIGLAHYGDLDGPVVFYFHGQGSSRLEGVWWAKPAEAVGAHIIALDRPGIGLSSVQPNRKMLDWPLVVSEVAQRLNIDQFYVLGGELGGTYALACAKELSPNALKGVGVVTCGWPTSQSRGAKMLGSFQSWVNRKAYKISVRAAKDPDPAVFRKLSVDGACALSKTDEALFENAQFRDFLVDSERECYRQGGQGVTDDVRISVKDWGFNIWNISAKVNMWCGDEGLYCPIKMNRLMEGQIDHARLIEFEGDTHFSILATKGEQILRGLLFDDEKSYDHPVQKDADN